jgi:hypothetical protein
VLQTVSMRPGTPMLTLPPRYVARSRSPQPPKTGFRSAQHLANRLVSCHLSSVGKSRFSLALASSQANCQSIFDLAVPLRSWQDRVSAHISSTVSMGRPGHCRMRTLVPISAIFSQLLCSGV